MVLPTTNLSMTQIRNEFGGTNPVSLNQYYRGGARVRNYGNGSGFINGDIATSGTISMGQFRGAANLDAFDVQSLFSFTQTPNSAVVAISVRSNGVAQKYEFDGTLQQPVITDIGPWYGGNNTGADFEIRATLVSGENPSGSPMALWLPLSSDQEWILEHRRVEFLSRGRRSLICNFDWPAHPLESVILFALDFL
jgi:hypothetical protein